MTGNPQLTETQETLLRQAKNCRDLAHFLRTDLRVEEHFNINSYFSGLVEPVAFHDLKQCNTAACAIGWALLFNILDDVLDSPETFGTNLFHEDWQYLFDPAAMDGRVSKRTPQEEAIILEAHADKLERCLSRGR